MNTRPAAHDAVRSSTDVGATAINRFTTNVLTDTMLEALVLHSLIYGDRAQPAALEMAREMRGVRDARLPLRDSLQNDVAYRCIIISP